MDNQMPLFVLTGAHSVVPEAVLAQGEKRVVTVLTWRRGQHLYRALYSD